MRSNSAPGLDGIPALLLKKCKHQLAKPLTLLWKLSFQSGIIPPSLKHSPITPIHKGGSRSESKNYRPVATLHLISV